MLPVCLVAPLKRFVLTLQRLTIYSQWQRKSAQLTCQANVHACLNGCLYSPYGGGCSNSIASICLHFAHQKTTSKVAVANRICVHRIIWPRKVRNTLLQEVIKVID